MTDFKHRNLSTRAERRVIHADRASLLLRCYSQPSFTPDMAVLLDRMPHGNHAVDMRSSLGGNGGIFRPQVQHNQPIQNESVLKARDRNLVAWAFSGTYDEDSPVRLVSPDFVNSL